MNKIFSIPTVNNKLSPHFGHCEAFAIVKVENDKIQNTKFLTPPAHQPGVYPAFLKENNVDIILAGGMGSRAISLFNSHGIKVEIGVDSEDPVTLVENYLKGNLKTGENACDH
ncbi:MAG: NifB/NifX family molybdenum-iron cluster-binding protein [Deltaproteobacteria bacterium]|jgi:ATP-binding protein involved in chromosome partitioning|nr:NifB/NifX family molybdenum-iron cluster-binding protein [Deltaproteobacteria bacterium]